MNENKALEDLAFIKEIIVESKKSIIYGRSFILWGLLIPIGLIFTFVCLKLKTYEYINFGWLAVLIPGIIISIFDGIKESKEKCEVTFIDKITTAIWKAGGISMLSAGAIGMSNISLNGIFVSPIICLILAVCYFITGELHRLKWLRNLSVGYWIGAILMFLFPNEYTLLGMAAIMIAFQMVPGIILQKQVKK